MQLTFPLICFLLSGKVLFCCFVSTTVKLKGAWNSCLTTDALYQSCVKFGLRELQAQLSLLENLSLCRTGLSSFQSSGPQGPHSPGLLPASHFTSGSLSSGEASFQGHTPPAKPSTPTHFSPTPSTRSLDPQSPQWKPHLQLWPRVLTVETSPLFLIEWAPCSCQQNKDSASQEPSHRLSYGSHTHWMSTNCIPGTQNRLRWSPCPRGSQSIQRHKSCSVGVFFESAMCKSGQKTGLAKDRNWREAWAKALRCKNLCHLLKETKCA